MSSGSVIARTPISLENEIKTMKVVNELVTNRLSKFTTTYEEDVIIFKDCQSGLRKRENNAINALICRMGEKKVYKRYQQLSSSALNFLKNQYETSDISLFDYETLLSESLAV
jgi:hypothetical protein